MFFADLSWLSTLPSAVSAFAQMPNALSTFLICARARITEAADFLLV